MFRLHLEYRPQSWRSQGRGRRGGRGDRRSTRKPQLERGFTPKRGKSARVREGNSREGKGLFWRERLGEVKKRRGGQGGKGSFSRRPPGPAGNSPRGVCQQPKEGIVASMGGGVTGSLSPRRPPGLPVLQGPPHPSRAGKDKVSTIGEIRMIAKADR